MHLFNIKVNNNLTGIVIVIIKEEYKVKKLIHNWFKKSLRNQVQLDLSEILILEDIKNNSYKIFIEKNIYNKFKKKNNKKSKIKKIIKVKFKTNGLNIKKNNFKILLIWALFKKYNKMMNR